MKISAFLFLLLLLYGKNSFTQNIVNCDNKYLRVVNATFESQVSGANIDNARHVVYNISLESKRNFIIENVKGEIDHRILAGKIIFKNTISDIQSIENGFFFVIRFERVLADEAASADDTGSQALGNTIDAQKNNEPNSLIYLSFSIGKKQYCFSVLCVEKKNSPARLLPQ